MADRPDRELVDCTDCFARPGRDNTCISFVKTNGCMSSTWHSPTCPTLMIMKIDMEEGSKRIAEQDAWAKGVFPAAHENLKQAAAAIEPGTPAQPFIDALTELVQAQADATGFVVLHRWAEILERHFPPELPDPEHVLE